ncbi:MAG TPA: hypothetical protein VMG41_11805 [Gemmatimonadales bacterium]|nr:hypothetical protein [Gemmatimonadales bacterium]
MTTIPVRVTVADSWDQVSLELPAEAPLSEAKSRALALTHVRGRPDQFLVKFRGAELSDEAQSLAQAGVVPNAALIVLRRRRRPVR